MDYTQFYSAALGGGSATVIMGAIMLMIVSHIFQKEREERAKDKQEICSLMDEVKEYKKQEITELKQDFRNHLEKDKPEVVQNEFKHISGALEKISNQVTLMVKDVAQLQVSVSENEKFTRSLHGSIREVRDDIKKLNKM